MQNYNIIIQQIALNGYQSKFKNYGIIYVNIASNINAKNKLQNIKIVFQAKNFEICHMPSCEK